MRFATENVKSMDSFTFLAFSAGPRYLIDFVFVSYVEWFRNCIGQRFALHQLKVTLANILNRLVSLYC